MDILKISRNSGTSWTTLPEPSKLTVNVMDLDTEASTRMADGTMYREVIGSKHTISADWSALTQSEVHTILNAIKTTPGSNSTYFFTLYYPSPDSDGSNTFTQGLFYVGDRSSPVFNLNRDVGNKYWSGLSCTFIEK